MRVNDAHIFCKACQAARNKYAQLSEARTSLQLAHTTLTRTRIRPVAQLAARSDAAANNKSQRTAQRLFQRLIYAHR